MFLLTSTDLGARFVPTSLSHSTGKATQESAGRGPKSSGDVRAPVPARLALAAATGSAGAGVAHDIVRALTALAQQCSKFTTHKLLEGLRLHIIAPAPPRPHDSLVVACKLAAPLRSQVVFAKRVRRALLRVLAFHSDPVTMQPRVLRVVPNRRQPSIDQCLPDGCGLVYVALGREAEQSVVGLLNQVAVRRALALRCAVLGHKHVLYQPATAISLD
jgi:hypothetical protein